MMRPGLAFFVALLLGVAACGADDPGPDTGSEDSATAGLQDQDGDGYSAGTGEDEDCNDRDAQVYPGAMETCNSRDDDCDGEVDEGVTSTYYPDEDGDGFGDDAGAIEACQRPDGYVFTGGDSDDSDPEVYPGHE